MIPQIVTVSVLTLVLGLAAPAPSPVPASSWSRSFGKNVIVTSKKDYAHLFWNAQDARDQLTGKERRARIVQAAARLVLEFSRPDAAAPDAVRIDIAFIPEKDEYGKPNWSSLVKVAHLETSRARLATWSLANPRTDAQVPEALFDKIEVF